MPGLRKRNNVIIRRVSLALLFLFAPLQIVFVTGSAFASTPQIITISPSSGVSNPDQAVTFTTTYSDAYGAADIRYSYFLVNTTSSSVNAFCAVYDQSTNKLYLRDNANTAWLGGTLLGSSGIIENSYAKLDCLNTRVSKSGNQLSISWRVIFKSTFTGSKNTYMYAIDKSAIASSPGWVQKGIWRINNPPVINYINPKNLSTFIIGNTIPISISAYDKDSDALQYRYLRDNLVIKDWTLATSFNLTTNTQNHGRHTLRVEAKDAKGATSSKSTDVYIFRTFSAPAS